MLFGLSLEHLETIFETVKEGLFTVDPKGTITFWNAGAESLTGYKRSEIVGKPCSVLMGSTCQEVACFEGVLSCALFTQGEVRDTECYIVSKSGERIWVLKNARVLKDRAGRLVGGVETLTDLRALKAAQGEVRALKERMGQMGHFQGLVGKSEPMLCLYRLIEKAADSDINVLVEGETGTGKELIAEAIHSLSRRGSGPLVKVNCSALPESLLESELFGHIRGAFTGADSSRVGRLEAAHRGTIFLDDIGELSPSIQLKLLRVLQERVIERLGENRPRRVDVRIIAATNRDLRREVQAGRFREDLFHRINVLTLKAPALRQRPDDIPLLVHHFIQVLNQSLGKNISGCSREALEALFRYPWPGNVRELRNALEYAFVLARGSIIELQDLPHFVASARLQEPGLSETTQSQKEELLRALEACGWNQTRAAKLLGISRVTVWNRMIRFGIERPGRRGPRQAG